MFTMSYSSDHDGCSTDIEMKLANADDTCLEVMFANFMDMMRKIGYVDGSWDSIIDNIAEWRAECGDSWVAEYIGETITRM